MKEEIKFRLIRDGEVVGYEFTVGSTWMYAHSMSGIWDKIRIPHDSKEQYITIKDSKGIELYAGDVVDGEYGIGIVVFDHGCFRVKWEETFFAPTTFIEYSSTGHTIKIKPLAMPTKIGTIHDDKFKHLKGENNE